MTRATAWDAARTLLTQRLRGRAEYWRRKAKAAGRERAVSMLIRALEADACADVAQCLNATYAAPTEPDMDMAARNRSRG